MLNNMKLASCTTWRAMGPRVRSFMGPIQPLAGQVYHSLVRAWAAVFVIVALLGPGLESLVTGVSHGCTAQVCRCRSPAPAAPAERAADAPKPCHEASATHQPVPLPDCTIRGACRHDA